MAVDCNQRKGPVFCSMALVQIALGNVSKNEEGVLTGSNKNAAGYLITAFGYPLGLRK
jgi:hypothetical protein